MKFIFNIFLLLLVGCGSGQLVPTKDICTIEKHYKDSVFQIQINDEPINEHWYTHDEAMEIAKTLVKQNKCMK